MSVPCPLPAPREHVQIERVRSHVLSVSPVLESLRMDSGAMVRVCGGMSLLMFACLSPGVCRSGFPNMPDFTSTPNRISFALQICFSAALCCM